MKKYFLIAGLLASQVQALDLNLLADEWLRLSKLPKTVQNVPVQNKDDKQIQTKTERNVLAQNRDDEQSQTKIQNNSNISTSDAELQQWIKIAEIHFKDDIREWKLLGINSPVKAKQWKDSFGIDQDLSQVRDFLELGINDPEEASLWRKVTSYNTEEIKEWKSIGISSPKEAKKWEYVTSDGRGVSAVKTFIELGITNPKDGIHWFEISNGDTEIIKEWFAMKITTAEQFMKWVHVLGYTENEKNHLQIAVVQRIVNFYNNKKNALDLYMANSHSKRIPLKNLVDFLLFQI